MIGMEGYATTPEELFTQELPAGISPELATEIEILGQYGQVPRGILEALESFDQLSDLT